MKKKKTKNLSGDAAAQIKQLRADAVALDKRAALVMGFAVRLQERGKIDEAIEYEARATRYEEEAKVIRSGVAALEALL